MLLDLLWAVVAQIQIQTMQARHNQGGVGWTGDSPYCMCIMKQPARVACVEAQEELASHLCAEVERGGLVTYYVALLA